jgi:hypothetical protein
LEPSIFIINYYIIIISAYYNYIINDWYSYFVSNKGLLEKCEKGIKCGRNWGLILLLFRKENCETFYSMSHNHSVTANLAPQRRISMQHFPPFPICSKIIHLQYYLLANVIHIKSTHSEMYVYTHTHIHARTHARTHTHIYTHTHTHTHTYTHIHTHAHTYTHMHTCTYIHTHTHTCTHIHTHMHTHTHTHTHTHVTVFLLFATLSWKNQRQYYYTPSLHQYVLQQRLFDLHPNFN